MSKEFIIEVENPYGLKFFITGGTYIFGGEKYVHMSVILSEAKHYSSKGRAISAGNRLAKKCINIKYFSVFEISK